MNLQELSLLIDYFLQNRNKINKVINDFGEIAKDNGHGTIFLSPKISIFKVFWIHQQNGRIDVVGLGGPQLGLTLKQICSKYNNYKEGFSRFEDKYIYVFFEAKEYTHTIKITSSEKLMEGRNIIKDIDINGLEISFR